MTELRGRIARAIYREVLDTSRGYVEGQEANVSVDPADPDEILMVDTGICFIDLADAVIRELGLREEWAPADIRHDGYVDPDTQWTYDRRADAEKWAAPFDQAVAHRYVTDWEAAE